MKWLGRFRPERVEEGGRRRGAKKQREGGKVNLISCRLPMDSNLCGDMYGVLIDSKRVTRIDGLAGVRRMFNSLTY